MKSLLRVKNHLHCFHRNSSTIAGWRVGWARTFNGYCRILAPGNTYLYFTGIMAADNNSRDLNTAEQSTRFGAACRSACTRSQYVTWLGFEAATAGGPGWYEWLRTDNRQAIVHWRKRRWACVKPKGYHFDTWWDLWCRTLMNWHTVLSDYCFI